MNDYIQIKGARVNNLKNIDLDIPRNKLIVITGLSGSGKSSLAFDTLYAEGQRRYVESLSAYARQFLGRMSKPECDYIKGIPPAIAIEQKVSSRNPAPRWALRRKSMNTCACSTPASGAPSPRERAGGEEAHHGRHRAVHALLLQRHALHRARPRSWCARDGAWPNSWTATSNRASRA